MLISHCAASVAGGACAKSVPLLVLFMTAPLVDIFWVVFILWGIENVRMVLGVTPPIPLDLCYLPVHARLAGVAYFKLPGAGIRQRHHVSR